MNTVTLSPKMEGEKTVFVKNMVYSGMSFPTEEQTVELEVKLRYNATPVKTMAHLYSDGTARLDLYEAHKFAPGQSAVLYRDGIVMCGGFID